MAAALQTEDDVRAIALMLSDAADAYNARLKIEAATLSSGEVFARLQEEQRLRGISNQLYFEAAQRTLDATLDDQAALAETLKHAQAQMAAFRKFALVLDLVADLLVLGGAILAGKPAPLLAALKEVRTDVASAAKAAAKEAAKAEDKDGKASA